MSKFFDLLFNNINPLLAPMARRLIRSAKLEGLELLLLPAPQLFDEEKQIETGFALEVNQDYFNVYPYLYNYNTNQSKVLTKLPHCVHKAIMISRDYEELGDEVIRTVNFDSAMLFVNNYLSDLSLTINDLVEVFDNKLYQQLINRVSTIKEPEWVNNNIIRLRLKQLLSNYELLDKSNPLYANNLVRANIQMINFLFGCEDNMLNYGFINQININEIKPFTRVLHKTLIAEGRINESRVLLELTGIEPEITSNELQEAYKNLFRKGLVGRANELYELTGVKPAGIDREAQEIFKQYLSHGLIQSAIMLRSLIEAKLEAPYEVVQEGYEVLIKSRYLGLVQSVKLCELTGIKPNNELILSTYEYFLEKGWSKEIKFLEEWLLNV